METLSSPFYLWISLGGLIHELPKSCFHVYFYWEMCSNLAPVRADVSRLPFSSGSVDAVHAGAALHCWPSLLVQ